MRLKKGFTLIELMIVIAIIAIIAAIAIPGLLQSQRASNERNASASLKTMATAEADFRANDRDGNKVQDFWTYDVSGLYSAFPPGSTSSAAIKLIEISIAGADFTNMTGLTVSTSTPGTTIITSYTKSQPKSGYWYYALQSDVTSGTAVTYLSDTDGTSTSIHNNSAFGFAAFPDSFSSGRQLFIVNEANTQFKRQCISAAKTVTTAPPGVYPLAAAFVNGSTDTVNNWPSDTSFLADYSKLD